MNVLLSAFSCAPGLGSEPGRAWGLATHLAGRHRVWVLTDLHNRALIEASRWKCPPTLRFEFVGFGDGGFSWKSSLVRQWIYYVTWQAAAFRVAKRLHREIGFDVVHHVSYSCLWSPSLMGYLRIPFVWTAGVADSVPWSYYRNLSFRAMLREAVRDAALKVTVPLLAVCTAKQASVVMTPSPPPGWAERFRVQYSTLGGLAEHELRVLENTPFRESETFRVATIGRLIGTKAVWLALMAFSELYRLDSTAEYWIIGEGPERRRLESLAWRLRCDKGVRFLGSMERSAVWQLLREIDVVLHPCWREHFGYAVLEALAAGRPVICLEGGGPSILISNGGGLAVARRSPTQTVTELVEALLCLRCDAKRRRHLSEQARRNATHNWSWDAVVSRLEDVYDLAQRTGPSGSPTRCQATHQLAHEPGTGTIGALYKCVPGNQH